jgi:hypothetical protein
VEEQPCQELLGIAVAGLHVRSQFGHRLQIAGVDQPLDHQVLRAAVACARPCPHRLGHIGIAHRNEDLRCVVVAAVGESSQVRHGRVITPVDQQLDQPFRRVPPAVTRKRPQLDQRRIVTTRTQQIRQALGGTAVAAIGARSKLCGCALALSDLHSTTSARSPRRSSGSSSSGSAFSAPERRTSPARGDLATLHELRGLGVSHVWKFDQGSEASVTSSAER